MIEARGTIDEEEVARFSRMSGQWWDAHGPMAALHKFNPVRLAYIRDRVAEHFDRDAKRLDSLKGLRILDIGCGGGILCEPLARLGAAMVGADASAANQWTRALLHPVLNSISKIRVQDTILYSVREE